MQFTVPVRIDRAADEVFAYATDPDLLATWQTNTVSSVAEPPGPLRLGTRLREVHRGPGGRELRSVVEVVEFERDRAFALHVVEGTPIDARMTFEPQDGSTVVNFAVHGRLPGVLRLAEPLLKQGLKRQFGKHCATLKAVLEAGEPADRGA